MADYTQQKVPDLKKLLSERGLVVSGNKADLIARLQEDDAKKTGGKAAPAEDEIDWDEDDKTAAPATTTAPPATTEPAKAAVAAGGQGPVDTPTAVPNAIVATDPATTEDLKVVSPPAEKEAPKQDFTLGIGQTDAEKEAERRAARAKRFGIDLTTDEEEAKKLERAKKFGGDVGAAVAGVKSLDDALPDRKRGREGREGGRAAKRQTPDRRTEAPKPKAAAAPRPAAAKKVGGKITDDPVEKAKAEARAKRFASAA